MLVFYALILIFIMFWGSLIGGSFFFQDAHEIPHVVGILRNRFHFRVLSFLEHLNLFVHFSFLFIEPIRWDSHGIGQGH